MEFVMTEGWQVPVIFIIAIYFYAISMEFQTLRQLS